MPQVETQFPSSKNPSDNHFRKKMKIGFTVLGAIVLIGILWGLWQWRVDVDKANYTQAKAQDKINRAARTPEKAVEIWENYRKGLPPVNYVYEADLYEGALLESMRQYDEALIIYGDAEQHRDSKRSGTGEVEGIARISELRGDYPKAIAYYTKMLAIYEKKYPGGSSATWTKRHLEQLKKMEQSHAVK
jgi:tetratricopeptide (TPR) repeat protein